MANPLSPISQVIPSLPTPTAARQASLLQVGRPRGQRANTSKIFAPTCVVCLSPPHLCLAPANLSTAKKTPPAPLQKTRHSPTLLTQIVEEFTCMCRRQEG